ncbi:ankyrin repeat domain-containing protein [Stieleria varia]|uniref:Phosphocholine transferase AnkX n=1 Tax=Stieleria varia TaxID=2528005 RepID=A0A5C6B2D8_9BACT|nr:ankyrin repeat domain-containing protein [Stieleria varia]TWU06475.1 Phosphocholine transferase AnkX [Stieleria varia]
MKHVTLPLLVALLLSIHPSTFADQSDVQQTLPDVIQQQDWAAAERILPTVADIDQRQPDGMSALHWAVRWGNAQWVRRLLEAGAQIDAANEYEITPLAIACSSGDAEITGILLDRGADPNTTVAGGETVLMLASRTGEVQTVNALIAKDADVNEKQQHGQTALMWAAAEGHVAVVDALLKAGADIDKQLRSGFNAWFFAAREGHSGVISRLLAAGVDVNDVMNPQSTSGRAPRRGMSALMLAVESGHFELALQLVDAGADPNDQRSGYAPLHAISWVRRPARGDNEEGDPPPRVDGEISSLEFVRQMVQRGADVNLRLEKGKHAKAKLNPRGATPFLFAAFTSDLPLMKTLKELGADIHQGNVDGCTPMLAAAGVGVFVADEYPGSETEVLAAVRQLHQWGVSLDVVDEHGETAVHGAAYRSFAQVVDLLVELGCEPEFWHRKNELGSTPRQIAQGKRPGSFKPNQATIAAIDRALNAAGIEHENWVRPADRKSWDDSPKPPKK